MCRVKEKRPGDMAEVYLTDVLKKYPFPVYKNERFISEDVVWIPMGIDYQTVYINVAIYQGSYLEDGLTYNDKPVKFKSPIGSMQRGIVLMNKECGFMANIKGAIIFDCYEIVAAKRYHENVKYIVPKKKILCKLMKPAGLICYFSWRKKL